MTLTGAVFPAGREEALKADFLRDTATGFFVDVGADAPQDGSQSFVLERRGWSGVLVEPQPDFRRTTAARAARRGLHGRLHRHLVARGYRWIRRTGINSWYAPADAPFRLDLKGRAQFVRKYYLGLPFRVVRDKKR
jgi:hypothetical protein